jgi:superfamily II DNA or RNA helicase
METLPKDLNEYLRLHGNEIADRIAQVFPPLYQPGDPIHREVERLRRKPYPAQLAAIGGVIRRWEHARAAAIVAECGTGKTLISLGALAGHACGRQYTAIVMMPPAICLKWARECFLTLPHVRVFIIDGLRNGTGSNGYTGVNEVRLRNGRIVREGLHTTLSDMRLRKDARSARARWDAIVRAPSILLVTRERAKLNYHWRHAYVAPRSGPFQGCVVNPDTGGPVFTATDQLRQRDFKKAKHSEYVFPDDLGVASKARRPFYSALWQADRSKVQRYAPIDFLGRYLSDGFFDYAIADEVHELKGGDTAQGNALGTLAACADRIAVLTGTLLGGYADEIYHILFRIDAGKMLGEGFQAGDAGLRAFSETYGVLERLTVIEPQDNACSEARVTRRIRRRPGASPLLFGKFLMELGAFVSLEDISETLPPYHEEVVSIQMDPPLRTAYEQLERDIKDALKAHPGNQSVISAGMNALLLYGDRPFGLGTLYGYEHDPETGRRERFVISEPAELAEEFLYAKDQRLVELCKEEIAHGRKLQIYAVYTQRRDVTQRWKRILAREGIRVEILTTDVPPEGREAWYERQLKNGMDVSICHPALVQTGLDCLWANTLVFAQTGYSTYVLRQASRRSWRIGQTRPVKVLFLAYANTMQESCLRMMGKKLLVSLAMEGKFPSEGLQALEDDDDMLTAMARELVTEKGVGEKADQVWRQLQMERSRTLTAAAPAVTVAAEQPLIIEPGIPLPPPGLTQFGANVRRPSRRTGYVNENQLSLEF